MIYRFDRGIDRQWKKKGTLLSGIVVALMVPAVTALALIDNPESEQGTFGVNGITITRGPIEEHTSDDSTDTSSDDTAPTAGETTGSARTEPANGPGNDGSAESDTAPQPSSEPAPGRGGEGPEGGTPPPGEGGSECLCEQPTEPLNEVEPPEQGLLEDLLGLEGPTSVLQETVENTTEALSGL